MRAAPFALGVAVLAAASAGCGKDTQPAPKDPFVAARQGQTAAAARQAAPRWEQLARLAGSGNKSESVQISRGALQWRIRWRCAGKLIAFSAARQGRLPDTRATGRCPGTGAHAWSRLGVVGLQVAAAGRWSAVVEQQFDTALRQPPLSQMRSPAARLLGRGRFYRVEGKGSGNAALYRLPTGRLALRLEQIRLPPTAGMLLWLSNARRPATSKEAIGTPVIKLGELKSTLGDQNYVLPQGLRANAVRSVVIWYKPTRTAYIAAAL